MISGPDTDWAYWFNSVPKGAKTGKDNGFSVLFDIESYDYGYYDEGSEGLKVAIVHHLDMPIIRQRAFHVAPGTENQIPVTPTLYTTNQQVSSEIFSKETPKPSLKIGTANAICWNSLGLFREYGLNHIFFRNKTFLFFKIES